MIRREDKEEVKNSKMWAKTVSQNCHKRPTINLDVRGMEHHTHIALLVPKVFIQLGSDLLCEMLACQIPSQEGQCAGMQSTGQVLIPLSFHHDV